MKGRLPMLRDTEFYIAHHTKSAGASFQAQQLLRKHNIFFIKTLNEACTVLKVKEQDLRKAKELLSKI